VSRRRAGAAALVLGALGALAYLSLRKGPPPPPTAERLSALVAERDRLQAALRDAVARKGEPSLARAPVAGVMIGLPTSVTTSIVEQAVTGLFGETTITLRNLRVKKTGEVRAKLLLAKRTLGQYSLDIKINRVQGVLKPGKPKLEYETNRVRLALPVHLAEGQGNATLHFTWDGKGAAGAVCGDLDVTHEISGGVVPQDYHVSGYFEVRSANDAIVLGPGFPDLAVRIIVDPSEQAWGVMDAVMQGRNKSCEIALDKAGVKERVAAMLGRGFNVKIPQKIFKPIRLPAGVTQTVDVGGTRLALGVKSAGVLLSGDRIWYGADVTVKSRKDGSAPRPE
jgi:hypothetical protein